MLKNKVSLILFFAALQLLIFSQAFTQIPKKIRTIIVDAGHGGHDAGANGVYEGGLGSYEKNVTLAITLKLVAELKKQLPGVNIVPTRTTDVYQSPPEKANIANANKGDLFICIHADALALKTGRRQISTRVETRYRYTYTGKGKRRKKISHPYSTVVPVYEYYKIPSARSGTSVWIFAAHKTSAKLKAIMQEEGEFEVEAGSDSTYNNFDFNTPDGRMLAQIYAKRYQEKSDRLATFVNDEVEKTGRNALGVNQRQKGIWVLQATNMPAILIETGFITNYEDERYINSEKGQQQLAEAITAAIKKYKDQIENPKNVNSPKEEVKEMITEKPANEASYSKRAKNVLQTIEVKEQNISLDLYDDGEVDGDIVSVYLNGKNIISNYSLTDKAKRLTLKLDPAKKENELVIYAENEGSIPPNTGLMIVYDGNTRHEVRFTADSHKNGVIIFSHK